MDSRSNQILRKVYQLPGVEHVLGETIRISLTLVVGESSTNLKVGGVSHFLGYLLGCSSTFSGCAPGWANSPDFGPTIDIRAGSAISCVEIVRINPTLVVGGELN